MPRAGRHHIPGAGAGRKGEGIMGSLRILGLGDNVCDKYVHRRTMYPGGQALNVAVYAGMLGAESGYLGVFGSDAVAEHVQRTLAGHGVDTSRCRHYPGANGCARVTLVDGDRVFLGSNKGGVLREHPLQLDGDDLSYIRSFHLCHTSNNSYTDGLLPQLRQTGVPVSYDFSGQWRDWDRAARVAPYVDYAFLSCGAASQQEAEDICRRIRELGAGMVIATRGGAGAVLWTGERSYVQPPEWVEPVDTLGAGDSFAAAFLLSYRTDGLAGRTDTPEGREEAIRRALRSAAAFSARTCLTYGAFGEGAAYDPAEDGDAP